MTVSVNRESALGEADSITITRMDGGWIVGTCNRDTLMACQTPMQVLEAVSFFFGERSSKLAWGAGSKECVVGSHAILTKVDRGFMASIVYSPQTAMQHIRFRPVEVIRIVGEWLGLQDADKQDASDGSKPPGEGTTLG